MKMYILLLAVIFAAGVAAPGADDVWAPQRLASPELLAEAGRVDRLEALTQRVEAISAIKQCGKGAKETIVLCEGSGREDEQQNEQWGTTRNCHPDCCRS